MCMRVHFGVVSTTSSPPLFDSDPTAQRTNHTYTIHNTRRTQDLLAAQSQLAAIFSSHARHAQRQTLPQDSAAAAAGLARGQCLEPGVTVRALIEQVARRPTREGAVNAALMVRARFEGRRGFCHPHMYVLTYASHIHPNLHPIDDSGDGPDRLPHRPAGVAPPGRQARLGGAASLGGAPGVGAGLGQRVAAVRQPGRRGGGGPRLGADGVRDGKWVGSDRSTI